MKIKFIESSLPAHYSAPSLVPGLEPCKQGPNGRIYQLLGISSKAYSLGERIWLGVSAFAKTFFSFGLGLLSEKIRKDWQGFWTGKKTVMIYHSPIPPLPLNPSPSSSTSDSSSPSNSGLKTRLQQEMEQTMGEHLTPGQKHILVSLCDVALQTHHPKQAFEWLVKEQTKQRLWGDAKAAHIIRNLQPFFPAVTLVQIQKIAQTPINQSGDKLVCFYKTGPTEFLGNFAQCPHGIQVFGHSFACSEAAFQWRKYALAAQDNNRLDLLNDSRMQQFFTCDGEKAFQLNRELASSYPGVYATNWQNGVRDHVMWEVLQVKFQQNPEFAELLQGTIGSYLLEHNEKKGRDTYWSDDHDGTGHNMLGKMLMALRDGMPCPAVNDSQDQGKIRGFAAYANQPKKLGYQIF